jgi:hypothetical protein
MTDGRVQEGDAVAIGVLVAGWGGAETSRHHPVNRYPGRFVRVVAPRRVALLAAALMLVTAFCLPSQARAADAPGRLEDTVETIAREHAEGRVEWARYVATSADAAAALLGKSRAQLFEGTPDRVYLVVMHGDFSLDVTGVEGRAPYLAFLYWRGEHWNASDFTLLQRPVAMRSAGVPLAIESFWLAHPTLSRGWEYALAGLVWFLPAVLLAASAVACSWRRRSGWPYVLAACVAVAVAGWQTYLALYSVAGRSWDPVFHGVKLGVLAVVVSVDLAAALVLLRARSRLQAAGQARADHPASLRTGLVLLGVAAALYVASLLWLASTGE